MIAKVEEATQSLVVFSDDWGRHPSSCQHLIGQLLPEYQVLWVNTIGTRAPRLDLATVKRVGEKLKQWTSSGGTTAEEDPSQRCHDNLTVFNPRMWPWFSRGYDRKLNSWLLSKQLAPLIERMPPPVSAITTLPITADLPGLLPVQKWLYYCVDDFGEWPGLDGETLRRMDIDMIRHADEIVAVSEHLREFIGKQECPSSLLTHGVDIEHWQSTNSSHVPEKLTDIPKPWVVFWGVVDQRLDSSMLKSLSAALDKGSIVLVGPQQDPDTAVLSLPNVYARGAMSFGELPKIAASADVLVMPYADLPVTRAMQPLKMKEYMATGRPVVVSNLPSVQAWSDCLDVTKSPEEFTQLVLERMVTDLPAGQRDARARLQHESWSAKARQLQQSL